MPQNEDGIPGLQEPIVPKPIHLYLILDVSPSMATRWAQTISGLNEYMASLRKDQEDNNQPYNVTMTTFSADVETRYDGVELDAIPTFTEKNMQRHGWGTALYDAVGQVVPKINTTDPVLVVVITDGEDNQSRSWHENSISQLLDERQKLGNYTYAYLGVSKEAWGQAAKINNFRSSNNNVTEASFRSAFSSDSAGLAGATQRYAVSMRKSQATGTSMNVSNFYADAPAGTEEDPK